jgi:hypothetical protein
MHLGDQLLHNRVDGKGDIRDLNVFLKVQQGQLKIRDGASYAFDTYK